jgi:hypothetical protein
MAASGQLKQVSAIDTSTPKLILSLELELILSLELEALARGELPRLEHAPLGTVSTLIVGSQGLIWLARVLIERLLYAWWLIVQLLLAAALSVLWNPLAICREAVLQRKSLESTYSSCTAIQLPVRVSSPRWKRFRSKGTEVRSFWRSSLPSRPKQRNCP